MSHSSVDFKLGDEGRISVMCDGPACEHMDTIRAAVEAIKGAELVGESSSSRKESDRPMAIEVEVEKEEKPAKKGIKNMCKGSVKK